MNTHRAPSPLRTHTEYNDNPEYYCREFRAVPEVPEVPEAPTQGAGAVTQLEMLAARAVDIAERVAEPVTVWDALRVTVKLAAWTARKLR